MIKCEVFRPLTRVEPSSKLANGAIAHTSEGVPAKQSRISQHNAEVTTSMSPLRGGDMNIAVSECGKFR
jgi:hypothetical protein